MKHVYEAPDLLLLQTEELDLIRTSLIRSESQGNCDDNEIIF